MQGFAGLLEERGEKAAQDAWSRSAHKHHILRVPGTIESARTFVRDEFDAYYLEVMEDYVGTSPADGYPMESCKCP